MAGPTAAFLVQVAFAAVLLVFASLVAMSIVKAVIPIDADDVHGIGLAAAVLTWGCGLLGVLRPAARRAFGRALPIRARSGALAIGGVALGTILTLAEHRWVMERFGYFELDFARSTLASAGLLAAIGVGLAAARVSERGTRTVTRLVTILAVLAVGAQLLSNVPGAIDGIRPAAVPLAAMMALAAGFLAVAVVDLLND